MNSTNGILGNNSNLTMYFIIVLIFMVSQFMPARTLVTQNSGSSFTGWEMTQVRINNINRGLSYIFGYTSQPSALDRARLNTRVTSFISALFAIFLGLCAILAPLVIVLILMRPVIAWWLTPTMLISAVWWFPQFSLPGFYLWFLSLLALSLLVINTLIISKYFRTWLNAFAGLRSIPFHIPVLYIVFMFIFAAVN